MNKLVVGLTLGGICAGAWVLILWSIVKLSPSPLWGLVAFPLVASGYWISKEKHTNKPIENDIRPQQETDINKVPKSLRDVF